jgi:hypothetical protein
LLTYEKRVCFYSVPLKRATAPARDLSVFYILDGPLVTKINSHDD